jgi:hypothetical protein
MRYLNNLEFEINYRIKELIGKHGPMSTHDPRVARLFKNLAIVRKLKRITYQLNPDYLVHQEDATCSREEVKSK